MAKKSAVMTRPKTLADKIQIIPHEVSQGDIIISGPIDDIQHIIWMQKGKQKHHILRLRISKFYPFNVLNMEFNPRQFQRRGQVTRDIMETLSSTKKEFSDMSHPVHWIGSVSKESGKISVKVDGILDGGHRHLAILDAQANGILRQHHLININLYEGYDEDRIHEMAKGLNSNRSLQDKTLMNYDYKFEMFRKAFPEQFQNGCDGKFKVMENQKNTMMDIDDLVVMLVAADPRNKGNITPFACNRKEHKEKFSDWNGGYARLYPKETLQILGQILDFTHLYMVEYFERHAKDLIKSARTRELFFIGKKPEHICKDKNYAYSVAAFIMKKKLVEHGKVLVWKQEVAKNPEKYVRGLLSDIGKELATVLKSSSKFNFGKESQCWQKVSNLIR